MNKEQFLTELAAALAGLPEDDIEKSLEYYSEIIDDRTEDGLSEEEAVAALGTITEIRAQIIKDTPLPKIIKEKVKPKRSFRGWEIAVIIIGFPLWFPLLIAAAAVILSVYVTLWSVIIAFFAIDIAFFAAALAGILASLPVFITGNAASGFLLIGAGLLSAGFGILWCFLCIGTAKGIVWLTKVLFKSLLIPKGDK